jgi:hypothetical protein
MRRPRIPRPSPAMVVALIALIVAVGGTSFAASGSHHRATAAKKIDTPKQVNKLIKKLAPKLSVKKAKNATNAVNAVNATNAATAANALALGGAAPSSYQHAVRWAEVAADGTILSQSGGITLAGASGGAYNLDFGANQAGKAILVTPAMLNSNSGLIGTARGGVCGGGAGGFNCLIGPNDANHVVVDLLKPDNTGDQNPYGFFVVVFQ